MGEVIYLAEGVSGRGSAHLYGGAALRIFITGAVSGAAYNVYGSSVYGSMLKLATRAKLHVGYLINAI